MDSRVIVFILDDRYDASDLPPRHRSHAGSLMDDDFDPGCTRTLFVGNIEKTTTFSDLKEAFERYGEIVVSCCVARKAYKCFYHVYYW